MTVRLYFILILLAFRAYADSHHPEDFLTAIKGSKKEGVLIYEHFCANCHAKKPIIPIGAPKFSDDADWDFRIQQGITRLLKHTDEGLNAMPPRGGCFECSDEQLVLAIVTMVSKKNKKILLNQLKAHKKSRK